MTYIEFFEKDAIENVCSSLIKAPDRIIFIGDNNKRLQKHVDRYRGFFESKGVNIDFLFKTANKNSVKTIVEVLSSLVEEYDDCVFDLTGGDDLYLLAAGIVSERYKEKNIQMHRFNIINNSIIDCDQDGNTFYEGYIPGISVEDNIKLYGGKIIYGTDKKDATYMWKIDADFINDVNTMWIICRGDVGKWNTQLCVFEAADRLAKSPEALSESVPIDRLKSAVEHGGGKYYFFNDIIKNLISEGLLIRCESDGEFFWIEYKNEQVKKCLINPGRILEMKVYLAALESRDKEGKLTYNDVMNGVCIDWDGVINYGFDTENEVDVMMMHGMVPVFVSCKNGYVDIDELYKLNTVAERFGGKYAKKVLVATALNENANSNYIRKRAEDMGIRLVEGHSKNGRRFRFVELDDDEIKRIICSLWSN